MNQSRQTRMTSSERQTILQSQNIRPAKTIEVHGLDVARRNGSLLASRWTAILARRASFANVKA